MLILTRRISESLMVGDDVKITVLGVKGNQVRIGIEAPKDIAVHREEIYRRIQIEQDISKSTAIVFVFDLSRNTDAAEGRHQHEVTSGNANVSRERWTLGANAFLDDLHNDFIATLKNVLDRRFEARP